MATETATVRGLLIAGKQEQAAAGKTFDTVNPATGEVIAQVAKAGPEDVDRAVRAARQAFDQGPWPWTAAGERGRVLLRTAALIRERAEDLAQLEMRNGGKTITDARDEVLGAASCFEYYAGACTKIMGETIPVSAPGLDMTLRQPVGVCAQIVPWNFPIVMAAWKMAPALAAGCTTILKPAGQTPLTALALGNLLYEAGIPEGAVNILPGPGSTTGDALIHHPLVDKIAFTGSTEVGQTVMHAAADGIKRVSLELGGKSPSIVFGDVDIESVVDQSVYSVFSNAGQDCCARSRFLVDEKIVEPFTAALIDRVRRLRVGDPADETTEIGPLISSEQRERVEGYLELGQHEGAQIACGGIRPQDPDLARGFFLQPAVLTDVHNDMRVAQEEIFGPVVAVIPFRDEEEAIRLANDSPYGLSGSLWTRDIGRAVRVMQRVRTGVLGVNSIRSVFIEAPFGGFKMSGIGRELGMKALDLYTEVKNVYIACEP